MSFIDAIFRCFCSTGDITMFGKKVGAVPAGEKVAVVVSPAQKDFIDKVAHPQLDQVNDLDQLKHFADLWWNLCQWEKQRADGLDGKAQMLLGLAGVATALLGANAALPTTIALWARLASVCLFLLTVAAAVWALRIRQHGGFLDREVFEALSAATKPVGETPPFSDKDNVKCYLRETALQRWFIYDNYKRQSKAKSERVRKAQVLAVLAILAAGASVVLPSVPDLHPICDAVLQFVNNLHL